MTLSHQVRQGVAWVASGEIARQATRFAIAIAMARLLPPADFGLVAMAMFFVGIVQVLTRCGLTEAVIQKEDVTPDDWSSVYWVGILLGLIVGVAIWLLAPVAALFYRDERLIPIVRSIGWVGLLDSFWATQRAWFGKRIQFQTIAIAEWCGVLLGGFVAVAMALTAWGVWSLVANILISSALTGLLLHCQCSWRPALRVQLSELRWAVRFGLGLQGFGIVNYLCRRLDDALIGRYAGPVELGYYSRAYDLMLYPVNNIAGVVGRVIFPALSSIGEDLPRFRAAYLRAVTGIATAAFPAMLGLLVTAPEVIAVVFGPQWMPAVPLVRVLSIIGLFQSVLTTTGWIYMARARTDVMLRWGIAAAVVYCSSFIIGVQRGAMGVAVAYALANVLLLIPCLAIPFRLIELPLADMVRSLRGVLIGAVLTAAAVAVVRALLLAAAFNLPIVLVGSVAIGVLIYLAWLWLTNNDAAREARLMWSQVTGLGGGKLLRD